MSTAPKVKICGLTRTEDARLASEAGADYLGAILSPGFARSISSDLAATFGGGAALVVAVFVDAPVADAALRATEAGAGVIQLHGEASPTYVSAMRASGDWAIWKALKVRSRSEVEAALARYHEADGLLLDGWHPGAGGGMGARLPWSELHEVGACFPEGLTCVVAGGLTPDNVAEAVRALTPDVVDVSSGVELSIGVKDPAAVRSFVRNAKAALVS